VANPPIQVSIDHTANSGVDIKNLATAGANTFIANICRIAVNSPCPFVENQASTVLATELQAVACGTYPPTASCQLSVSQWNFYLVLKLDPKAAILAIGDGTQLMTAQQYAQTRAAAGL